ncbi:MAG: D-2-hydroxyacid dehydrogenase [Anaerolineae bacterium]|nr:D-2-hydroxyacid dehydrogenase [Anaerolineae bacterium]
MMPNTSTAVQLLITVELQDDLLETLRDISSRIELLYHPARHLADVPGDIWAEVEILYTTRVMPDPALAPKLRWIQVHSAGVDHLRDQSITQADDVIITTTSGIHTTNITEYVMMMMLAFGHRLPLMMANKTNAHWPESHEYDDFLPQELRGSTVGIVGYGSIGREIARIARAFGLSVLAVKRDVRQPTDHDSYVIPGTGDPNGECFDRLYPPEALNTMVRECDFVVITVPLTDDTHLMFGPDTFEAMKPSAYLINVGRGGVIDEQALLHALQNDQIAGAALDVFHAEPLPADSPLWKQPNLIISPHVSGNTSDYNQRAVALFVENLERYLAGKSLLNRVEAARGY